MLIIKDDEPTLKKMQRARQDRINSVRPLTPIQKDSLRPDWYVLETLIPYCEFLIGKQWEATVTLTGDNAMVALIQHLPEKEHQRITIWNQIYSLVNQLSVEDEAKNPVLDICEWVQFSLNGINIRINSQIQNQYSIEFKGAIPIRFQYEDGFHLNTFYAGQPGAVLLTYLYLLDLKGILHGNFGKGNRIPRFLSAYPNKEINSIIFTKFESELNFLRQLALDGIEFKSLTVEEVIEHLNIYVMAKARKKNAE